MNVESEHNAGKEPYKLDDVKALIAGLGVVIVTSGKKILEFEADVNNEDMMKKIIGRSGNLRAPSLRIGSTLYVGYNQELYDRFDG